jgi:hypothetical protein
MPSLQDIMGMYQSFDPYASFKEGQRAPAEQEIQDIATKQQLQEARAEQAQSLGQMAGAPQAGMPQAGTSPLAMGAKSIFGTDKVQLTKPDGTPTLAGDFQENYLQNTNELKLATDLDNQSKKVQKIAATEKDPTKRASMLNQASEIALRSQNIKDRVKKSQEGFQDKQADSYARGLLRLNDVKSQAQLDSVLNNFKDANGYDAPEFIPRVFSKDGLDKALKDQRIPPLVADKYDKLLANKEKEEYERRSRPLELLRKANLARGEGSSDSQLTNTISSKPTVDTKNAISLADKFNKKATKTEVVDPGDVKSAMNLLDPEYRPLIGTAKGIHQLQQTQQVVTLGYKIANEVKDKEIVTGAFGDLSRYLDKFDGSTDFDPSSVPKVVDNQILSKEILDFINSYARSESGRNIATVAEIKQAIKVFSESSLSGRSTYEVFKAIGDNKLKQFANSKFDGDMKAFKSDFGRPKETSGGGEKPRGTGTKEDPIKLD